MKPSLEQISKVYEFKSFHFLKLEIEAFPHLWHYHPEIELTYIKKGRGIRYIGDQIESFEEGDLVLLGENLPHTWATQGEQDTDLQCGLVFQFPLNLFHYFPELSYLANFLKEAEKGFHFPNPSQAILQLIEGFELLNPTQQLITLIELIDKLSKEEKTVISTSLVHDYNQIHRETSRINRIKGYLHENFHQKVELEQIAQMVPMSPTYFSAWFKKSVGHPLITYVNKLRIEQASRWLLTTDWDIAEIAYKSGFQHVTHFNRVFKQEKNMPPSTFRVNHPKKP
ncbi:AraC family transcriptional regulator [Cecembia lonarensis]|uniref:Bacillibactin transport regulator n=1 Tax=Cecembia lonarensis (strain CCUG 58316 / KCTC 22772 / LW9) TaxID=1225176 RepID=K1M4K2_CECL9|nr:AraC family transcriptional regulator [Cecembia lonarensis]EKB51164.1 Bacillibactin transport regulator [Cecembia lonarensis LW9]